MSSPRKFVDALLEKLDQDGRPCQFGNDLPSLEDLPGAKIRFLMEVEGLGIYKLVTYDACKPMPLARRVSKRKKPTAITKSTVPSNHTSTPAASCERSKRPAPRDNLTDQPVKSQRTSSHEKTAVTRATRTPLEPLDANTIPTNRLHTTVTHKPKFAPSAAVSQTTKEVTDFAEGEDEQFDHPESLCDDAAVARKTKPAPTTNEVTDVIEDDEHPPEDLCNDKAKDLYGMLMEAATYPRVPGDHFRRPIRLRRDMNTADEKAIEIMNRNAELDDKSVFGRLSLMSLGIQLAHLVYEECRKKGKTFDGKQKRQLRGKPKYGKWDLTGKDYQKIVNDMFRVDSSRTNKEDAKSLMSETREGKDYRRPGNLDMDEEAFKLMAFGRKWALLFDEGGPGAIWLAASGPVFKPRYSVKEEFRRLTLYHEDFINGDKKRVRFDRNMFTAYADKSFPRWRAWMEEVGIPINTDVDPLKVQVDDLIYRGGFNEGTKTYNVEILTPNEIKFYITNRTIGDGFSGMSDWEDHLKTHKAWSHEKACCAVWNKPPIQVYETEIPELGKGLMATKTLPAGAYVAEHAGVCKPASQCTNDGDEGGNEKDRMELAIPGRGKYYILTDTRSGYTKYINHSDNPNIYWVAEENSGAYRMFLRVKEGCTIRPGDELTADYGPLYWEGKQKYNGPRFLLH